ncbi:MAG: TRAP transporter large permease [Gemmatimonadota bacterium]|nr:TRAP transporter large permease [Gemmatimonadota bacterium]MDH3423609.1 TRAP transporter large permease [Gemmatimonadota bacterium]
MIIPISGLLGIAAMFVLLMLGVPIAFSMAITGAVGLWILEGPGPAMAHSLLVPWDEGRSFVFVTIPLFVLMGQLVFHTGLATDLYRAVRTWIGPVPGGMAITSVVACGAFGAVTGSSIATVATMGAIVMPEMRRYNYNPRLATGALAASGTLGILIPPSVIFIFYGVMTETSIGELFIAGIIPGILTATMFSVIILVRCMITPSLGPPGPSSTWAERWSSTVGLLPIMALFGLVIGGIYAGIFTPTEAAGVGCTGVLVTAGVRGSLTRTAMSKALEETALISAMIFAIIVGGYLFARFLAVTGTTEAMVDVLVGMDLGRVLFLVLLVGLYIILGAMLDVFGMLVLTIPFVMPIVRELGIDPIWFGVFAVVMAELALVTPPIGANVFVMRRTAPEVPMGEIFMGVLPFVLGELVVIALLIAFPEIALWLPGQMR